MGCWFLCQSGWWYTCIRCPWNSVKRTNKEGDGDIPRTNSWCTNGGFHSRVYDSRIGNPSVGDPRIQDTSANNFNGSRIKWSLEDTKTFQDSKNQWVLKDWRTIEGSRIRAKFENLWRKNLHVHVTACQREMYEYGDQNVTTVLVHWKISFDEDTISQQHLVGKVFSRGGKC